MFKRLINLNLKKKKMKEFRESDRNIRVKKKIPQILINSKK